MVGADAAKELTVRTNDIGDVCETSVCMVFLENNNFGAELKLESNSEICCCKKLNRHCHNLQVLGGTDPACHQ